MNVKKILSIFKRPKFFQKNWSKQCVNPNFNLIRHKNECDVMWKNELIVKIPYAHLMKNQFKGGCFIIASGPSLAEVDLKRLTGYQTISLNCAIKKFIAAEINPTHCIIVDPEAFKNEWLCIVNAIKSGANCFFSFEGIALICERDATLLSQGKIYLIESITRKFGIPRPSKSTCKNVLFKDEDIFIDSQLARFSRSIGFSANLEKGLFSGKTVATWAVQLAYGLGYRKQFIIGMDLGGTGKNHFYQDGNNPPPDFLKDYDPHIRVCFEQAKRASIIKKFEIYNLSKNSTLPNEIIPKIDLNAALELVKSNDSKY